MLFEALEKVLAGTAHANLVNDLYQARRCTCAYVCRFLCVCGCSFVGRAAGARVGRW